MDNITTELKNHYKNKFLQHGPTSRGVDWGKDEDVLLRHKLMYDVVRNDYLPSEGQVSILDVGCGYGAFYEYLVSENARVHYTGIDVVEEMIQYGRAKHVEAEFILGDFLSYEAPMFDYIVCNGILTQKLKAGIIEMDRFANTLIKKMFLSARKGIAFNIMSSRVNFMVENLYYRHPADVLTFCLTELSGKVRIEHSNPMYEYTTYVYKR
jgi:SAM-dependent methyltransferase